MSKKNINIAIIGFGTVGTGTAKILLEQNSMILKKTGLNIKVKTIVDLDITTDRKINLGKTKLTTNYEDVLNDKSIDIVVEVIGGINPAKKIILNSLKKKKNVVTANKALLAYHGKEIFNTAIKNKRIIAFEASTGGGIPILKALKEGLNANDIENIYAIINGTANYILTNMSLYNKNFNDVLKDAQEKGFAEADPTFDIEGNDTAHKLTILSSLAYGIPVDSKSIYCEGITKLKSMDFKFAHTLGYEIKLLAIAKKLNNVLDLRVHPTLIPSSSILAQTLFENNAVFVKGNNVGPTMFYGKGAGKLPTASAIVSDVIDISKKISINDNNNINIYFEKDKFKIIPMFALKTKYYLRLITVDKPYVLSTITKILSDNKISVASLIQTDHIDNKAVIIIMTHPVLEKSIQKTIKLLNDLPIIKSQPLTLRVEEDFE